MPKMRKKYWSKVLEVAGLEVRIFERPDGDVLWYSVVLDGRKVRRSLETKDRTTAEERARAIGKELATAQLIGLRPDALTLAQIFAAYRRHRVPTMTDAWAKAAETRIALFTAAWGGDQPVADLSQTHVDRYSADRRAAVLTPLGKTEGRGMRRAIRVRDGTLDADFRWLSSVFNWARRHKEGGRRLLSENPLHDVDWPREANPRRPVASHDRYTATLGKVDEVDPKGRLRCILALARFTGRREGAICALSAGDVLRAPEAVRAAVAGAGMDERLADHMPHGAIRWREATDKMGLLFISPLSKPAREELDRYLKVSPRLGEAPLFPADVLRKPGADSDPVEAAIRPDVVARWLLRAEAAAELPKLRGGIFHPYRRLWASERKHMPDVDVAAAGGWKDTRALKLSYQHADPATVLRVVEGA